MIEGNPGLNRYEIALFRVLFWIGTVALIIETIAFGILIAQLIGAWLL